MISGWKEPNSPVHKLWKPECKRNPRNVSDYEMNKTINSLQYTKSNSKHQRQRQSYENVIVRMVVMSTITFAMDDVIGVLWITHRPKRF